MEMFSPNYATAHGRAYAASNEEYLQESFEPPYRLTNSELQQIREIREEIESRPKSTRFELRYIRVLEKAEDEFSTVKPHCSKEIRIIRSIMKELQRSASQDKRAISIAMLISVTARL